MKVRSKEGGSKTAAEEKRFLAGSGWRWVHPLDGWASHCLKSEAASEQASKLGVGWLVGW